LSRGSTKGFVVWPEWSVEQCAVELVKVNADWETYLAGLTTAMLLHTISYVNSKGERWENTVTDILTHMIIHSGYHRGQIAADVRAAGGEPAYTDFIHAVRNGWVEEHGAQ
jgi:uncharacterized damage-inducible protein DinB